MKNWFRYAFDSMALAKDIYTWLMHAAQSSPQESTLNDDISSRMGVIDDPNSLQEAITIATGWVTSQQGGYLNPEQQSLIQSLQLRMSDQPPMTNQMPNQGINQQDSIASPGPV